MEIFADKGLYLGVSDSTFYDPKAYQYDKATGEILRNEAYDGLNALFQLPIDASKADPAAAANYLTTLDEPESVAEPETNEAETEPGAQKAVESERVPKSRHGWIRLHRKT